MSHSETQQVSPEVIRALTDSHRKFLAFLQQRVESREVAEDILQTAFVRALERASEIRDEETVVAWFYRVLRNAVIDHYRHRAAAERASDAWSKEFAGEQAPDVELAREICGCVAELLPTLRPEYREAVQLVDVEERSLKDLAQAAGITAGNAAVRVHRARQALRQQVLRACGTCAEHGCLDCRCKPGKSGSCSAG